MPNNFVQPGKALDFVVPTGGVTSGQGLLIGNVFGVVSNTEVAGEVSVINTKGVWSLAKAAVAITAWEKLYWDNKLKVVTNIPAGNHFIGYATKAKLSGDAEAEVVLVPSNQKYVDLIAPSGGVTKGVGYIIGAMFVVAMEDAAQTVSFRAQIEGEAVLSKNNSQATTLGAKLYWSTGSSHVTTTNTSNWLIGTALKAEASNATTQLVWLSGIAITQEAGA